MICKCCYTKVPCHDWWSEEFKKKKENDLIVCNKCYDLYWLEA